MTDTESEIESVETDREVLSERQGAQETLPHHEGRVP